MSSFKIDQIKIDYDKVNDMVKVTNNSNINDLKVWIINVNKNFCPLPMNKLKENHWVSVKINYHDKWRVYIGTPDLEFFVFDLVFENGNFSFLKINDEQYYNFDNEICFIIGHSGGGTSIVSKALRYFDIHFGDDCGNIENRKSHESIAFRLFKLSFKPEFSLFKLRQSFSTLANIYDYKTSQINCVKITDIEDYTTTLGEIFPKCKFISIVRKQNNFYTTNEGKRFNQNSEIEVLKKQFFVVEGQPMFHLKFEKFFSDFVYFNKVLQFLGTSSKLRNQSELENLKLAIEFDDNILK